MKTQESRAGGELLCGCFSNSKTGADRAAGYVICDAREHVGEPSPRTDAVKFGGLDQREHDGGALAAEVRIIAAIRYDTLWIEFCM